jgi:hypothetical protein
MTRLGPWLDRTLSSIDTVAVLGSVPFVCLGPVAALHNAPWLTASDGSALQGARAASSEALLLLIPEMLAVLAAMVLCAQRFGLGGNRPMQTMWHAFPNMLLATFLGVLWLLVLLQPWPGVTSGPGSITVWLVVIAAFPLCAAVGGFPLYGLPRFVLHLAGAKRPHRTASVVWMLGSCAGGYVLMSPAGLPGWFDSFGLGPYNQDGIKVLLLGAVVAVCGGIGLLIHVRPQSLLVPRDRGPAS